MSTFKQKSLFAALAGLGVLGVVDSAQAVHINNDGLGQALIYPYYTVRSTASGNNYVTALTVVNTTSAAKVVKVRFLEGKNSREVLDFNLFLSQYDVWTGGIVPDPAGIGAGLFTKDHSCTTPAVSTSALTPTKFRNGAYVGDTGGDTLDRTNEGYFEILEMATIVHGSALEAAVTHVSNLSAPNASTPSCTGLPITAAFPAGLAEPTGGLFGDASLINVNDGTDFTYDAVPLDGWSNTVQWTEPGSQLPTLANVTPKTSVVIENTSTGGEVVRSTWVNGRDAVSAVMMRADVYNTYTVEPNLKAATDWIVTMPTKRFYVSVGGGAGTPPFQSNFRNGSCDNIALTYYDREEQSPGAITDFSPTTPESRSLCWEANVLTFTGNGGTVTASNVLRSTNYANVALDNPWINGWADLNFPFDPVNFGLTHSLTPAPGASSVFDINSGILSAAANVRYFGLPVIGLAVESFTNGLLPPSGGTSVLSNYGGNFIHKYARCIFMAPTDFPVSPTADVSPALCLDIIQGP